MNKKQEYRNRLVSQLQGTTDADIKAAFDDIFGPASPEEVPTEFDPETYEKLKPIFLAALESIVEDGIKAAEIQQNIQVLLQPKK